MAGVANGEWMAARQALNSIDGSRRRTATPRRCPLAGDTESGFARFFVPALIAALLTTAALAWQAWSPTEAPRTGATIATLSF
jgi:hypothetical protein